VFYGCGTSSLTLKEKYRSFEDRVFSRIFGSEAEEVITGPEKTA
jgi:hypothetical protein